MTVRPLHKGASAAAPNSGSDERHADDAQPAPLTPRALATESAKSQRAQAGCLRAAAAWMLALVAMQGAEEAAPGAETGGSEL